MDKYQTTQGKIVEVTIEIDYRKFPFPNDSYEYNFDKYFDIPEGIPNNKYTDKEAHQYALYCLEHQKTSQREDSESPNN